jgi:hypothetical protein
MSTVALRNSTALEAVKSSPKLPAPKPQRDYSSFDEFVANADQLVRFSQTVWKQLGLLEIEFDWLDASDRHVYLPFAKEELKRAKNSLGFAKDVLGQHARARKRLADFRRDEKWYDRKELYEVTGTGKHQRRKLSRRVVTEQIALLLASFQNSRPGTPKAFSRMLIEEVYAKNPNACVLESACRRVRREKDFPPSIAEVLKAIDKESEAWCDRWELIEGDPLHEEWLRESITEAERTITKAEAEVAERERKQKAEEKARRVKLEQECKEAAERAAAEKADREAKEAARARRLPPRPPPPPSDRTRRRERQRRYRQRRQNGRAVYTVELTGRGTRVPDSDSVVDRGGGVRPGRRRPRDRRHARGRGKAVNSSEQVAEFSAARVMPRAARDARPRARAQAEMRAEMNHVGGGLARDPQQRICNRVAARAADHELLPQPLERFLRRAPAGESLAIRGERHEVGHAEQPQPPELTREPDPFRPRGSAEDRRRLWHLRRDLRLRLWPNCSLAGIAS